MVRINRGRGSVARPALISLGLLVLTIAWGSLATRGADQPTNSGTTQPGDKPAGTSPGKTTPNSPPKTPAKPDPFALPKGKSDLFPFIVRMKKFQPQRNLSEDDKKALVAKAHWAIVEAADKILTAQPTAKQRYLAMQSKLEALNYLDTVAYDNKAGQELHDYLEEIKQDKQFDIVRLAAQYASAGHAAAGPGVVAGPAPAAWADLKAKLSANPDDVETLKKAIEYAGKLENPINAPQALSVYKDLETLSAKSKIPQAVALGKMFAVAQRRLTLVGRPIEISGTLLDGKPLNANSLKGRVVLVEFWATWAGPKDKELSNMLQAYQYYHNRGFEVIGVSLDEDKGIVQKFVAEQKIPWPILYREPKSPPGMDTYYGVTGIPTAILTNPRGEVVSLDARGQELNQLLVQLLGR